jgi:hypothetical protein
MTVAKRCDFGYINKIIKTELKKKLKGERRCAAC